MFNLMQEYVSKVTTKRIIKNMGRWTGAIILALASSTFIGTTASANSTSARDAELSSHQPYGAYLAGVYAAMNNDLRAASEFHDKALALDPDNRMILRKAFPTFLADGKYDSALKAAHKLTEMDVSDSMVQMLLFMEQLHLEQYDAALDRLENVGDAGVYGLFKPLFKAWTLVAQGKPLEAETELQGLMEKDNFRDFKQFHAGIFYDYLGKPDLAEKMFTEALAVPGTLSLRTVEAYGSLLRRSGRDTDARQLFTNYLAKAPDNQRLQRAFRDVGTDVAPELVVTSEKQGIAEIFYTAANFLMQDDIRVPATLYLRYAQYLTDDMFVADYLLGQVFEADKYYSGALESYARIPATHSLYFNGQLQSAWVLEKMGRVDEAIAAMRALSADFPEKREVTAALGDVYRMHRRFGDAVGAYSDYIGGLETLEESHWSIFYTRGIVYEQDGDWPQAEADFLKALELRPEQPQVMNYLAYSWVDKGVNMDEARNMLEKAVALRPHDGYIIDSFGWALYRIGDMEEAVAHLEKAVLLQTDDWAINDHLGDAYWAVGRKTEAKFQWRHAISLKPEAKFVEKIRTKIKKGLE